MEIKGCDKGYMKGVRNYGKNGAHVQLQISSVSPARTPFSGIFLYGRLQYSIYNQLLKFMWYSLLLTPSSCLIQPLLFKFQLTWDIKTTYRYSFSFTIEVFFYRHNIYLQTFCAKWIIFTGNIISRIFPDFVKSRTFPASGKWISYFSRFPGCVRTLMISLSKDYCCVVLCVYLCMCTCA